MEDEQILNLYFSRSEQAIGETASKYGPYCHSIAMHVLENEEDAEECVSDTWFFSLEFHSAQAALALFRIFRPDHPEPVH